LTINTEIDKLVTDEDRNRELMRNQAALKEARARTKAMARRSRSILNPFAAVVVGGSSQAVGSPVNAARIAHHLTRGTIRRVTISLGPELFARRTINSPGILAAAVYGSATDDSTSQAEVFQRLQEEGVKVSLKRSDQAGLQRIEVEAERGNAVVTTLNRGGGRIHLLDAQPSLDEARRIASALQIELAE
jgi:L-serine dehydratase